jgi:hypothetical protein
MTFCRSPLNENLISTHTDGEIQKRTQTFFNSLGWVVSAYGFLLTVIDYGCGDMPKSLPTHFGKWCLPKTNR